MGGGAGQRLPARCPAARQKLVERLTTVLNEAERLLETTDVPADNSGRCELLTERIKTFATSLEELDRNLETLFTAEPAEAELEEILEYQDRALPVDLVLSFQRRLHSEAADATGTADDRHEKVVGKLLNFIKMETECRQHIAAAERTEDPQRFTLEIRRNDCPPPQHSVLKPGADFYWAVVTGKQMQLQGSLIALETTFGWTLQGPAGDYSSPEVNTFHVDVSRFSEDDLDERLQSFWDVEHLGIADAAESLGNDPVLQRFEDSTLLENGRYSVGLPWQDNLVSRLRTNKTTAEVRLRNATRTLLKDQAVMNEYELDIRQYLENGHAERVDVTAPKVGPEYYLPHHAVIRRERETTKVRIVFDASSKAPGLVSLNDVLHAGPNLNSDILSLLLRFRMHPIALVSDIEKAFLQIGLHKQDTDALRFLWYSTTPVTGQTLPDIETWQMTRVPVGARSSSFLLSATIRHHLRQSEWDYPETAALLQAHFYVDDLVVSVETSSDAEILYQYTLRMVEAAGMKVKKWVTNDGILLRQMFNDGSTTVETTQDQTKKVLGLVWDVHNDKLRCPLAAILDFVANETNDNRHILQSVSGIYDPFGLLAPFTITGEILLQRIWEAELDWDDLLPEDIKSEWKEWCAGVGELEQLSLPRFLRYSGTATPRKMHVFVDASPFAYGAVIYVEASSSDSSSMEFLVSKSRVVPPSAKRCQGLNLWQPLLPHGFTDMSALL
ncbi:uncharacterized protein LOC135384311 [Ornithodoros turicata]|uniref:uncharacterized protein LOC135384311 n=1 Tax=Ornithodoros turicata TaxID=34597 RepID=UPI0031394B11